MNQAVIDAVFRPKLSSQEAKADAITRNVRAIVSAETAIRDAKTARLRAARLANEAETPVSPAKAPRSAPRRQK